MKIWERLAGSDRDRFAAQALSLVRRAPGTTSARYDRADFAIAAYRDGADKPVWLYLSNAYAECADASRSERRAYLERFVRAIVNVPPPLTWSEVQSKLRPVLRPVTFGQAGPAGSRPPLSRSALPYLHEMVVIDHPDSMAYVLPTQVEEWGVAIEDVYAAAHANLDRIATRMLDGFAPPADALIRMIDSGDGYFTSLLLAPGWLDAIGERLGAPAIAFIPDVRTVLLCSAGNPLGSLFALVESEYTEAPRSLSPVGYVASPSGAVRPYSPVEGHDDYAAARRAERVLAVAEYQAQTQRLRSQYEEHDIDVFIASLLYAEKPGAPAITVTTWVDQIESLLPRADFIAFARGDEARLRVAWDVVAEHVELRPEPLLNPARYRVGGWPEAGLMEQLQSHNAAE